MNDNDDAAELLFFDTFSHEVDSDINLDLVQFPKPVYITQVRIIPLGARVQADFPGGVRLGATNPSKFDIEFFVNDLGMPGASTFENLGRLEYDQNDCIHLECTREKIPTDGLVLRGWYSTITLAVYGILTNSVNEHIASPPLPPPCEPAGPEAVCNIGGEGQSGTEDIAIVAAKEEWKEPLPGGGELAHVHSHKISDYDRDDLEYGMTSAREHYGHGSDERERDRRMRKASRSSDRSASSRNRTHSESNERDFLRSRSPEYSRRSRRKRSERSRSDIDEPHKWPRTPPASVDSPTRPRSPDTMDYTDEEPPHHRYKGHRKSRSYARSNDSLGNAPDAHALMDDDDGTPGTPGEQYEPILSDDEIMGDDDSIAGTEQSPSDEFDESELQAAAAAASSAEPAIVDFDPFTMPIQQFAGDLHAPLSKELDNLRMIFKKFEQQTDTECFGAATTTVAERESFVFLGEQLIIQLAYLALQFKRRQTVLKEFFASNPRHLAQAFGVLQVALSFEAACLQPQPAFKIRHIKVGARLTELLGFSEEFIDYVVCMRQFDLFAALFELYAQPYMALSIKLMLLKAVYALLDTRAAILYFLYSSKVNGYQLLLDMLLQTQLTRTKYALRAILKKLHLHEALASIRGQTSRLFSGAVEVNESKPELLADEFQLIERAIEAGPLEAFATNGLAFQQPRRFLPVSKKFEIIPDSVAQRSFDNTLRAFCSQHTLAESLLLLLTNAAALPPRLLLSCVDLLHAMLQTHVGIDYLVDDCFGTTQMIVAVLLNRTDVVAETAVSTTPSPKSGDTKPMKEEAKEEPARGICASPGTEVKSEQRDSPAEDKKRKESVDDAKSLSPPASGAEELPAVVVKRPQLNRLHRMGVELAIKVQTRYHLDAITFAVACEEYDAIKIASHLHLLHSQMCKAPARKHTVEVLGLNNNLQVLIDVIKQEQHLQAQRQLESPGAKYKSPVLNYAIDLVDFCVRYSNEMQNLTPIIEHGAYLLELTKNHESFEPSVSAVLQEMFVYLKPLEAANIFTCDDITPLVEVITRALEYITTFPGDLIVGLRILRHLIIGPDHGPHKTAVTLELKTRYVALQFFAADGVQTLLHILERLCTYFEQPGLHTPALVTTQGVYCMQIMLPTLQLLRVLLSFAIKCRDIEYRDLSAIDYLMKAYCLLYYFPAASQAADDVAEAKAEIVRTMLSYSQPKEQDEESLHRSLWTQMIREVLKNIDAPSTFVPGLQVLSELLPLPLPMPMAPSARLSQSQTQRLITERKLWSAHLHPQSSQIAKLIETMAPSSFPPLSALVTRVCLQLADLAPNMTLLISKTLTDLLCSEWAAAAYTPTQQLVRLLQFFARLTAYASLKSSALSILSGKLWDLFQAVLSMAEPMELGLRCQVAVHRILESFLDSEISLVSPQSAASPEVNLASALPPKELIPRIVDSILTSLGAVDVTHEVSALAVRNLVILTEHDITFYHLALVLRQRCAEFQQWLQKVIALNETGAYNSNIESLAVLLRSLAQIEDDSNPDANLPSRTLKLSSNELAAVVGFKCDAKPNLMQRICTILAQNNGESKNALLEDICKLRTQLEAIETAGPSSVEVYN